MDKEKFDKSPSRVRIDTIGSSPEIKATTISAFDALKSKDDLIYKTALPHWLLSDIDDIIDMDYEAYIAQAMENMKRCEGEENKSYVMRSKKQIDKSDRQKI